MKKIFVNIIIAAGALLAANFSASAQSFVTDSFTTEGRESINGTIAKVRAFESRQHGWQKANGEYAGVKLDQHWIGLTAGATYLDVGIRPIGGIAIGKDGGALWTKEKNGVKTAVRLFSYEVGAQLTRRQYLATALSAGEKYLAYQAYAVGKVQIVEDRWVRHRLNLVLGGGYVYGRDDYQDVSKPVGELESGNTIVITDDIVHEGNGVYATAGLEYRFRLSKLSANALMLRAMADYRPVVRHNVTTYGIGGTVTLAYSFALNSRVK